MTMPRFKIVAELVLSVWMNLLFVTVSLVLLWPAGRRLLVNLGMFGEYESLPATYYCAISLAVFPVAAVVWLIRKRQREFLAEQVPEKRVGAVQFYFQCVVQTALAMVVITWTLAAAIWAFSSKS